MDLVDRLKDVGMGLAVLGAVALNSGCAFREGNQRVSFFPIPFVGVAVTVEEYEDGANRLKQKMELFATGGGYDMKQYGAGGVYKGVCKIRISNFLGDIKIHTTAYDKEGKKVYDKEGLPDDMPDAFRGHIR